jgi:hypothetical protein
MTRTSRYLRHPRGNRTKEEPANRLVLAQSKSYGAIPPYFDTGQDGEKVEFLLLPHDIISNANSSRIELKINLCLVLLVVLGGFYVGNHLWNLPGLQEIFSKKRRNAIPWTVSSSERPSLVYSTASIRTPTITHAGATSSSSSSANNSDEKAHGGDKDGDESASTISVLVVYVDDDEGQRLMAEHVSRGAMGVPRTDVVTVPVSDASFRQVLDADGIILGSSVENGNTHPAMQGWINESWDARHDLSDKVGATFVTEEGTMNKLLQAMMIFRMAVVGGDAWTSAFGASAITAEYPFSNQPAPGENRGDEDDVRFFPEDCYRSPDTVIHPMFLAKARGLGARLATVAHKLNSACPS